MSKFTRALPFILLVVIVFANSYLASLRCSTSPAIDWSRLGLGILIQAGMVIAVIFARSRVAQRAAIEQLGFTVVALFVTLFLSFVLVRQPLLLSDTTHNKFFASGSYQCPGFPASWR